MNARSFSRLTQKLPSEPVTVSEFSNALYKIWKRPRGSQRAQKAGLAISGGVDSMALARLCSDLRLHEKSFDWTFCAYIIDHAARKGSNEEAKRVAERLDRMSLNPRVIRIQWPESVEDPLRLSNFETRARKLRFQALGHACVNDSIKTLLLGHHADDQPENFLLQLLQGRISRALTSMPPSAPIPECEGIYGVGKSGTPIEMQRINCFEDKRVQACTMDTKPSQRLAGFSDIGIEGGGVRICRPLLGFTKEQLKATCLQNDTEWVEDETNNNVTLTPRNAIRMLLLQNRLPLALQSQSIHRSLLSAKARTDLVREGANGFSQACSVRLLDLRTGTLFLNTPTVAWVDMYSKRFSGESYHFRESILRALHETIQLVTPRLNLTMDRLQTFDRAIRDTTSQPISPFTSCGLLFEEVLERDAPPDPVSVESSKRVWKITRAPLYPGEPNTELRWQPSEVEANTPGYETDGWKFWDGRYWIWIRNRSKKKISVRLFQKEDMRPFLAGLSAEAQKRSRDVLKRIAPGKLRWTLPVICSDRVLALPTIGLAAQGAQEQVEWLVRYKNIDIVNINRGINRRSFGVKGKGPSDGVTLSNYVRSEKSLSWKEEPQV